MSSTKDWFFEKENNRIRQWIAETYCIDEDDIDENSPEWATYAQEYSDMQEQHSDEEYRIYLASKEYFLQHPYNQMYVEYQAQQLLIRKIINNSEGSLESHTVQKMAFVHAVTLMEALIGDMIKSLVVKHSFLMKRVGLCIDEPNPKKKMSIKDVIQHQDGIDGVILNMLSMFTFHNISATKKLLDGMFPDKMRDLDYSEIHPVIEKRHDFVHRNGKNLNDEPVPLTIEVLIEYMDIIHRFASQVYGRIHEAMAEYDNEGF